MERIGGLIEELAQDDEVFIRFINRWSESHPEKAVEVIADWMEKRIADQAGTQESEEWRDFLEREAMSLYYETQERAYEERLEDRFIEKKKEKR